MMYLLDTNTISDYLKGNPGVLKNLKCHHHSLVAIKGNKLVFKSMSLFLS